MKVAVIGGGASGFFAALSVKEHHPESEVIVYEKSPKTLSKVKVSGGGRCNVTHYENNIAQLLKNYPRGSKLLKKAFRQFAVLDTIKWFKDRGVDLHTEADNRMFPVSNNSQTIIDIFRSEASRLGVKVLTKHIVSKIHPLKSKIKIVVNGSEVFADKVVLALGGQKRLEHLRMVSDLGIKIEMPVPSLFTFNIANSSIVKLQGLSVPNALIQVQGTKLKEQGPVLITHWGFSGPAVLKTSAFGAKVLAENNYQFSFKINWLGAVNEDQARAQLGAYIDNNHRKQTNKRAFDLPSRLWEWLISDAGIKPELTWGAVDKKSKNRLINSLVNSSFEVIQKTTFKEEFVICGGIALSELNPETMALKNYPNVYATGELLNIDGVTGGFNFQAAWTTGFIAGKLN